MTSIIIAIYEESIFAVHLKRVDRKIVMLFNSDLGPPDG